MMKESNRLSRRSFVGGLLSATAGYWLLPSGEARAEEGDFWKPKASPLVKQVMWTRAHAYFAYPHSNGFLTGSTFVVALRQPGTQKGGCWDLDFISFDPVTRTEKQLAHVPGVRMYYSIANNGQMLVTDAKGARLIDLNQGGASKVIYEAPSPWAPGDVSDLSPDGGAAVFPLWKSPPNSSQIVYCDIAKGSNRVLLDKPWAMNHPHFSPFDPKWTAFCHEGAPVSDRIWAWNKTAAAEGRMLFNQVTPQGVLNVGHERARFDKEGEIFVAYRSAKTAGLAGLYEVGFDKTSRQVSASETYLHCNISHDGRWAVVDSQPVGDPKNPDSVAWGDVTPPRPQLPRRSDVIAINMKTGARQFLYAGRMAPRHPWHVHPHISPDGRWVVFNDYEQKRVCTIEIDQAALETFLA